MHEAEQTPMKEAKKRKAFVFHPEFALQGKIELIQLYHTRIESLTGTEELLYFSLDVLRFLKVVVLRTPLRG